MSFCVEFQANNGQVETIVFGNEDAAKRYAATKKLAMVLPAEVDAPDAVVKKLAPRGKARPKAKRRDKKPAKSIEGLVPKKAPVERPKAPGFSLGEFLAERLAKKAEEKAA
jgi:hypothetical protein